MSDDVRECLDILDRAVKFEETGMAFFLDRAESAPSELERNLFRSLAADEKGHRAYLLQLKEQLLASNDPEDMQPEEDHDQKSARQIFESALEDVKDPYTPAASELEIIQGAMEVERKGYDMYTKAVASVQSARAKEIFAALACEEQHHYSLLKNTYDYLADPSGWHGFDEGSMLDGG